MTAKELAKFYDALLNKKEIPKGIKNIRILSNNLSEFLDKLYSDFFSPSVCDGWIFKEICNAFNEYHQHESEEDFLLEIPTDMTSGLIKWASYIVFYRYIEREIKNYNGEKYWELLKIAQYNLIREIRVNISVFLNGED